MGTFTILWENVQTVQTTPWMQFVCLGLVWTVVFLSVQGGLRARREKAEGPEEDS